MENVIQRERQEEGKKTEKINKIFVVLKYCYVTMQFKIYFWQSMNQIFENQMIEYDRENSEWMERALTFEKRYQAKLDFYFYQVSSIIYCFYKLIKI